MKQLICCSVFQLNQLYDVIKNVKDETIVLASPGPDNGFESSRLEAAGIRFIAHNQSELPGLPQIIDLQGLQRIYFVVSESPMSSSAYQAMIYSLGPWVVRFECWRITLEETEIPLGFVFLRNLPEGAPALNAPKGGTHWWRSLTARLIRRKLVE